MMKFFLIIIFSVLHITAFSQFKGAYKKNDTLNVLTIAGLNLRQSPSATSNSLTKIPYGSRVQVIDDSLRKLKFTAEEIKGWFIEGFWVKVKFKEKVGYLFDGYLSKFPAINYKDTAFYEEGTELHFLKTYFRSTAKRKVLKKYQDCKVTANDDCMCAFEVQFNNGISYSEDACSEAGSANTLKIKGTSLTEMYLFAKALAQYWNMGLKMSYDLKNKVINFETTDDGVGCGGTIKIRIGIAIFEWGCYC